MLLMCDGQWLPIWADILTLHDMRPAPGCHTMSVDVTGCHPDTDQEIMTAAAQHWPDCCLSRGNISHSLAQAKIRSSSVQREYHSNILLISEDFGDDLTYDFK